MKTCLFIGCSREMHAKGLCFAHYQQLIFGKELSEIRPQRPRRPRGSLPHLASEIDDNGCRVFTGCKNKKGYGISYLNGKSVLVHRSAWEAEVGPIPEGMVIDHKCRNRACCNVDHLRVVTPKVNNTENVVGSGWQRAKAKTHCARGHEFTEANTMYLRKSGHRKCRTCKRIADAARYAKGKSK